MGLAGLGLTARAAAPVLAGVFRAPAYFTELWVALGLLAFVVLSGLYLLKVFLHFEDAKAEFTNPAKMGFCATLPVAMTLVAGGVAPYVPRIAEILWWCGVCLYVAFQLWGLYRLLRGGIELAQANPGWMVLFIGGIVVPGSGIALGHVEVSLFTFAVSAAVAPFVVGLLAYRALAAPALPAPLRPSWFILLVPPSLIYAHGVTFFPGFGLLEYLFPLGVALAIGLLVYARGMLRWPFSAAFWSVTFPLDALAYAAVRYAQSHPSPLWKAVAGAALVLATLFVCFVLLKNLHFLFATRRSAASPAA
jgi:tellurite resistance protein